MRSFPWDFQEIKAPQGENTYLSLCFHVKLLSSSQGLLYMCCCDRFGIYKHDNQEKVHDF